ncbi:MAG: hypothetical protein J5J06_11250 [Phycisphaerae bacterium]|nr:hypothetical protein [Phycisphaerae bacterium]
MSDSKRARRSLCRCLGGTLLAIALTASLAPAQDSSANAGNAADPAGVDAGQPMTVDSSTLPRPKLVPLGKSDESTYRHDTLAEIDDLLRRANGTADVTDRLDLSLTAANRILGLALEPAVTARFYELPDDLGLDAAKTSQLLTQAEGVLEEVGRALGEKESASSLPVDVSSRLQRRQRILAAFAGALHAYLAPGEGDPREVNRQAAVQLSVLLEEFDPVVPAAAGFWQAILRTREGDLEGAMLVLPLALSEPNRRQLPWDYFSRLLRCRVIARNGGYPTAIALLTQVEERCDRWLPPDNAEAGRNAAIWFQLLTLREWSEKLPGDSSEREWCARQIRELADMDGADGTPLLRLSPAIPILGSIRDGNDGGK